MIWRPSDARAERDDRAEFVDRMAPGAFRAVRCGAVRRAIDAEVLLTEECATELCASAVPAGIVGEVETPHGFTVFASASCKTTLSIAPPSGDLIALSRSAAGSAAAFKSRLAPIASLS